VNVFEDPYTKLKQLPDPETPPDATIVGLNGVVVDLKVPPYAKENILIFSTQWKSEN
jgi:xanthosine utilization system XapX-like protein